MIGLVLAVLALGTATSTSSESPDAARIRAQLEEHPDDVDARLQLAFILVRADRANEARQEAMAVIQRAPKYWDAHILVARIDGWAHRFDEARKRNAHVLRFEPENLEALFLAGDIELWAREPQAALARYEELLEKGETAEAHLGIARARLLNLNHWAAYRAGKRALALDPKNRLARQLVDNIRLVAVNVTVDLERLVTPEETLWGHGEIINITLLPRSRYSLTLSNEFRRRFDTTNNRVSAQGNWRVTDDLMLSGVLGFSAPAFVLPQLTGGVSGLYEWTAVSDVSVAYRYDRYLGAANLHRLRLAGGLRPMKSLHAELAYTVGVFDTFLSDADVGHTVVGTIEFDATRFRVRGRYGYGSQLDRSVRPADPLLRFSSHFISGLFGIWLARQVELFAIIDTEVRDNDTRLDRALLGIYFFL